MTGPFLRTVAFKYLQRAKRAAPNILRGVLGRARGERYNPAGGTGDVRLTGSKYLWLRRPEDLSETQRAAFRALQREDLKVGRAWALKERFRTFWEYRYPGAARTFFTR